MYDKIVRTTLSAPPVGSSRALPSIVLAHTTLARARLTLRGSNAGQLACLLGRQEPIIPGPGGAGRGAGGDAMLPASRHGCDASQLPCRRCNHHLAGLPRCLRARLFTPGHAVPPEALPLRSHSGTTLQRESVDPNARSLLVVDDDGRSCGPTF